VWVADLAQFRVHVFSRAGTYRFQVPRTPQPPALGGFNTPSDVAVDSQGFIWVIDTMNQRFQKFAPNGTALEEWGIRGGPQAYGFNYPRGIAVGPGCNTYTCVVVADSDTGSIVKYDADGDFLWSYGAGTAPEGQQKAWSLAVADNGDIYAPLLGQHRVLRLSSDGDVVGTFGAARLEDPHGISVDPEDGTIWVADRATNKIQHFQADGDFIDEMELTDDPGEPTIQQAMDVQVSATHVYVSDTKGHRILVWTKDGDFFGVGASASGAGAVQGPMGMDIANGHLYVAETVNNRIHDFTISG
jgi:DNA-binding beta-propeller fold protein YncE